MKNHPFEYLKSFGLRLWFVSFLILLLNKLNILSKLNCHLKIKKNSLINNYLCKKYKNLIEKYKNSKDIISNKKNNNIWLFWWQGIDNAPLIVKKCINSIRDNYKGYNITIIDKNNYKNFYDVPSYIEKKIETGCITITHFSDILRMNLLKKYGGFWIDSTIFITKNKKFDAFKFNTIKFHCSDKTSISNGKWCGFYIGGNNKEFYNFMAEFLDNYWKNEKILIDYFLIDYIIKIAYDNIKIIKDRFDEVEFNNEKIHELQRLLNHKFNKKEYENLLRDNWVHKLSYKEYLNESDKENYFNNIFNE